MKVHGVTGGHDILTPDAILFREKCKSVGVDRGWLEWISRCTAFQLLLLTACLRVYEGNIGSLMY